MAPPSGAVVNDAQTKRAAQAGYTHVLRFTHYEGETSFADSMFFASEDEAIEWARAINARFLSGECPYNVQQLFLTDITEKESAK